MSLMRKAAFILLPLSIISCSSAKQDEGENPWEDLNPGGPKWTEEATRAYQERKRLVEDEVKELKNHEWAGRLAPAARHRGVPGVGAPPARHPFVRSALGGRTLVRTTPPLDLGGLPCGGRLTSSSSPFSGV